MPQKKNKGPRKAVVTRAAERMQQKASMGELRQVLSTIGKNLESFKNLYNMNMRAIKEAFHHVDVQQMVTQRILNDLANNRPLILTPVDEKTKSGGDVDMDHYFQLFLTTGVVVEFCRVTMQPSKKEELVTPDVKVVEHAQATSVG